MRVRPPASLPSKILTPPSWNVGSVAGAMAVRTVTALGSVLSDKFSTPFALVSVTSVTPLSAVIVEN